MSGFSPEQIMLAIQACWCEQLKDAQGVSTVGACCITATVPVVAECCAGFAWVRLVGAYPSMNFPALLGTPENCRLDTWALTVEIGVARCVPEPCDVLDNSCCEGELAGAVGIWDDFARMRRLWTCCLPVRGAAEGLRSNEIIPGAFQVGQRQGNCVTRSMMATLFTDSSCGC